MLAKQAEQASRRARSFAFLLGKADAWAAQKDEVPSSIESDKANETSSRLDDDGVSSIKAGGGKEERLDKEIAGDE